MINWLVKYKKYLNYLTIIFKKYNKNKNAANQHQKNYFLFLIYNGYW